jgi:hypothetical protein
LTTLPARMHDVQTARRRGVPLTSARTFWMFGSKRRFVRRWECDTFMPKPGFLPHNSHTAAIGTRHLDRGYCREQGWRLPSSAMVPSVGVFADKAPR